jgi:hypothetical protein
MLNLDALVSAFDDPFRVRELARSGYAYRVRPRGTATGASPDMPMVRAQPASLPAAVAAADLR